MGMETGFLSENNETGLIVITGVFLMFFMSIILLLFFYFSKKKIIQKELEKKNLELDYQKELILATLETQEAERMRIAQDLHDDISSKLNIVSLNTHLLATPDLTETEVIEITDNIIGLVTKTLESSRRIAHDLLPPVLEKFGLDAALKELCFDLNNSKSVNVRYQNNVALDEKDKIKHLHVFRIVQELMNNSVRHGKASEISLTLESVGTNIRCSYSDNGIGFDDKSSAAKKGLGMNNIESRIIFIQGTLSIESAVNKGTNVIFIF
jgi:signal transduction histidine kinase